VRHEMTCLAPRTLKLQVEMNLAKVSLVFEQMGLYPAELGGERCMPPHQEPPNKASLQPPPVLAGENPLASVCTPERSPV